MAKTLCSLKGVACETKHYIDHINISALPTVTGPEGDVPSSGISRVQKQVGHLGAHKKCNLAISIEGSLARLVLMCVMNTCLVLMYALLL